MDGQVKQLHRYFQALLHGDELAPLVTATWAPGLRDLAEDATALAAQLRQCRAQAAAMAKESASGLAEALRREMQKSEMQGRMVQESNELLITLMDALNLGILVVDSLAHEILFKNEKANTLLFSKYPECEGCPKHGDLYNSVLQYESNEASRTWDLTCARSSLYYRANTHRVLWHGMLSYAHIIEDVSQQTAHTTALAQRVYTDDMTGLYNRRYCMEQINDLLGGDNLFTVCYFDIDNLKYVNDVFGHVEGDEYILLITGTVKQSIRNADVFGRMSGDEFLVIFRNTPAFIVEGKFEAITEAIRANSHITKPYDTSISFGVLEVSGASGLDVEALLRIVDEKMYRYKRAHKPRIDAPQARS